MRTKLARIAVSIAIVLWACCPKLLPAATFRYEVGSVPSGMTIEHPDHTWREEHMLGPGSNYWAYDNESVVSGSPGPYNIHLEAIGTWTDKDKKYRVRISPPSEEELDDVDDEPYAGGTGVWWSDSGADGTFTDQSANPTQYIPGATGAVAGLAVTITLWMRDAGKWTPGNSNDNDNEVDTQVVNIFDSHLSRDIANIGTLNGDSTIKPNCELTADHAFDGGLTGASTSVPPWGGAIEDGTVIWRYGDTSVNTQDIDRGDCVTFLAGWGADPESNATAAHIATCTEYNSEAMWQRNGCPNHNVFDNTTSISSYISNRESGCSSTHSKNKVVEVRLFNKP